MNYIEAENQFEIFMKNISIKQKFDTLITKSVSVTADQIEKTKEYAKKSVSTSDYYKSLVPKEIKDEAMQKLIGEQRVFVEKIAECAFVNYLIKNKIDPSIIDKKKIGIKTAIAKDIHTRLIIDKDEFEKGQKKNYYVGIHLNLQLEDKKDPIKRHIIKDLYNMENVQIYGYLDNKFIQELRYETVKNKEGKKEYKFFNKKSPNYEKKKEYANLLGENCKWYYMNRLMPINNLISKFR